VGFFFGQNFCNLISIFGAVHCEKKRKKNRPRLARKNAKIVLLLASLFAGGIFLSASRNFYDPMQVALHFISFFPIQMNNR
jgi:hypothetical protein